MERDFRYKMRHIGDAFVDKVENLSLTMKGYVKGIALTYNIDELKEEKEKIVNMIGKRTATIRDKGTDLVHDDVLIKLFDRLDVIQGNVDASIRERKTRLYPNKT